MFFEPDDKKLAHIEKDYKSGKMLTGELKKYTIDKIGQDQKATVINEVRKAFGYKLTNKEANALSNTVIRADLVSLTRNNGMKLQDVVTLLMSESTLDNAIKTAQNQLFCFERVAIGHLCKSFAVKEREVQVKTTHHLYQPLVL